MATIRSNRGRPNQGLQHLPPSMRAQMTKPRTHGRTNLGRSTTNGEMTNQREREAAGWNSPCAAALYSGPARGRRCERGCVARGLGTAGGSAIYSRAGAGRGSGGRRSEVGPHGVRVRVRVYLSFGAESILASRAGMHVRTWRADTDRMAPRRRRSHPLAGRQ